MLAHKRVLFRSAARERLLEGTHALADAVRVTLGPKSKSVLIGRRWGSPLVCNDGVTIAKEFQLEDPEANLGAQTIRQAAERTGDAVGDGTTTSTILAQAIFADGVRHVVAGASAIDLKKGLERGLTIAVATLKDLSRPVTTRKDKEQVACIAAHNDAAIGRLIADALEKVGAEGAITVEEAKGTETAVEIVEGMQFDRGYLSPYFVTDASRMEAVLDHPYILLCDRRIASMSELVPILELVAKEARSFLLIAEDVEGEALATLVVNKLRGILPCAAVKAPGFGDNRKAMLGDLAALTSASVIAPEAGMTLEHLEASALGSAQRVVVSREATTIAGGAGDKCAIGGRIAQIRTEIDRSTSDYDKEKLRERLSKLSGGVAVIRVGAPSEAELKSRKEAFDDAISACKAAIAEGLVPGAGLALLRAMSALEKEELRADGDERSGLRLLRLALEVPTRQLAENSGVDPGVVVERMKSGQGNYGFDAARGAYVDLMEAGIVDATKVVRVALENAVSVASMLLLTEATLVEVPGDEKQPERGEGLDA
ncbi:MAG: chaperonin GroEL [Polyangiales bacterium]